VVALEGLKLAALEAELSSAGGGIADDAGGGVRNECPVKASVL